jgi:hypothetical protein
MPGLMRLKRTTESPDLPDRVVRPSCRRRARKVTPAVPARNPAATRAISARVLQNLSLNPQFSYSSQWPMHPWKVPVGLYLAKIDLASRNNFKICAAVCFFPMSILRSVCTVSLMRTGTRRGGYSAIEMALQENW